jgi:glycosyltransferase involved in cell wall biosynthesis
MLIYIFAEHYPTPYKPYFDTQFAYLIRQGHTVKIFAFGKYTGTLNKEVRHYELDSKTSYLPTTLKTLPRFVLHLVRNFFRHPATSIKQSLITFDKSLALKQNLMLVSRMLLLPSEQPALCLVHNLGTAANFSFLSVLYPNARVVMYFHGGEIPRTPRVSNDKEIFKKMNLVFTNTEFSRKQAIKRGCDEKKIRISPVGFYIPDYPGDGLKEYRMGGMLRLISVGRLGEEKGIIYALEAIRSLLNRGISQIEYRIIGHGYLSEELMEFTRKNGISNHVVFAGEKTKDEVTAELKAADVLILPSLVTDTWAETQACVVQEAMLMRSLVVTTKTGGVQESIPIEMHRFSVQYANSKDLANKILDIFYLTDTEMCNISEAGRKYVIDKYNIELVTNKLLQESFTTNE